MKSRKNNVFLHSVISDMALALLIRFMSKISTLVNEQDYSPYKLVEMRCNVSETLNAKLTQDNILNLQPNNPLFLK